MSRNWLAARRNARIDLIPALAGDNPFDLMTEDGQPISTEDDHEIVLEQES